MGILEDLFGGGQRQQDYADFVNRYEQGHPAEGYSDAEVVDRYREVAHAVPPTTTRRRRKRPWPACPRRSGRSSSGCSRTACAPGARHCRGPWNRIPAGSGRCSRTSTRRPAGCGTSSAAGAPRPRPRRPVRSGASFASPLAKAALAGITAMIVKRVMQGPNR